MRRMIFLLMLLAPFLANADDISEYEYYARSGSYVAYIKKDDHCVYGGYKNDIHKYCEMGNSGLNLEKNYPDVYAVELHFSLDAILSFIVAAPWSEQKCKADMYKNTITCEPTGN